MKGWEYNTYKNAEKARKWKSKQRNSRIQLPKRNRKPRKNKYTYGQPTTIRHKGVR